MARSRGQYEAGTCLHFKLAAAGAADQQGRGARGDPQHFVGTRMVMLVSEHAVRPDARPSISCKKALEATIRDRGVIDQHWKLLVVRDPVASVKGDGFDIHALHPLFRRLITFVVQRQEESFDIPPLAVGQRGDPCSPECVGFRGIPVPVARGSKIVVNHRDTTPAKPPVLIGEFF
ncbi:hypothetical protein D3C73_1219870 [compost metagenome]